jgi:hypothetical protein
MSLIIPRHKVPENHKSKRAPRLPWSRRTKSRFTWYLTWYPSCWLYNYASSEPILGWKTNHEPNLDQNSQESQDVHIKCNRYTHVPPKSIKGDETIVKSTFTTHDDARARISSTIPLLRSLFQQLWTRSMTTGYGLDLRRKVRLARSSVLALGGNFASPELRLGQLSWQ